MKSYEEHLTEDEIDELLTARSVRDGAIETINRVVKIGKKRERDEWELPLHEKAKAWKSGMTLYCNRRWEQHSITWGEMMGNAPKKRIELKIPAGAKLEFYQYQPRAKRAWIKIPKSMGYTGYRDNLQPVSLRDIKDHDITTIKRS